MKKQRIPKKSILVIVLICAIAAVGLWYARGRTKKACVSYYDQAGTAMLYQDCR